MTRLGHQPCVYLSSDMIAADVLKSRHLATCKPWRICNGPVGKCPSGQPVYAGTGCGPKCSGYSTTRETPVSTQPVMTTSTKPARTVRRSLTWAYGVTTCPQRLNDLFPQTVASLSIAGFDNPVFFVDGLRPEEFRHYLIFKDAPVVCRWPAVRVAGNWVLSLYELYYRNPTADRYALFQDDLVACLGLRAYLDAAPYPEKGYLNLYTFPENLPANQRERGYRCDTPDDHVGFYPSNQRGRGAVALVFNRAAVQTLLRQPHLVDRPARRAAERPHDPRYPHRAVDGGIVEAMSQAGYREYVHAPSLVQHTGDESSFGNRPHPKADTFRGVGWDARSLLPQGV